jgi:hypothetical protein
MKQLRRWPYSPNHPATSTCHVWRILLKTSGHQIKPHPQKAHMLNPKKISTKLGHGKPKPSPSTAQHKGCGFQKERERERERERWLKVKEHGTWIFNMIWSFMNRDQSLEAHLLESKHGWKWLIGLCIFTHILVILILTQVSRAHKGLKKKMILKFSQ